MSYGVCVCVYVLFLSDVFPVLNTEIVAVVEKVIRFDSIRLRPIQFNQGESELVKGESNRSELAEPKIDARRVEQICAKDKKDKQNQKEQ